MPTSKETAKFRKSNPDDKAASFHLVGLDATIIHRVLLTLTISTYTV